MTIIFFIHILAKTFVFCTKQYRVIDDETMQADAPLSRDVTSASASEAELTSFKSTGDDSDADEELSVCPPPPKEIPSYLCHVTPCTSDKSCHSFGAGEGGRATDVKSRSGDETSIRAGAAVVGQAGSDQ